MKKILLSCVILALGTIQMPANASMELPVTDWNGLKNSLFWGVAVMNDISAPDGAAAIESTTNSAFVSTGTNSVYGGGNGVFSLDSNHDLTIAGDNGGVGYSYIGESGQHAAISNNGDLGNTLTLSNVEIINGINQGGTDSNNITLITNGSSINPITGLPWASGVILSGNAGNISSGKIEFGKGQNGSFTANDITLTVAGGTISAGAGVVITEGNTLQITNSVDRNSSGNVTLNSNQVGGNGWSADSWAGNVQLAGTGNLTLSDFSKTLADSTTVTYSQTGGTLTLTNGSSFTLSGTGGSITGGNVTIQDGTFTVNNGVTVEPLDVTQSVINNASITMNNSSGIFNIENQNASSATPTYFKLNSGTSVTAGTLNLSMLAPGSQLVVGTGATIGEGAQLNLGGCDAMADIYTLLRIEGGNVTLDAADAWDSQINLSSGSLTLDHLTHNTQTKGPLQQSGGTLTLENGANLTFVGGWEIMTNGSGTGTTIVNIGQAAGVDGSTLSVDSLGTNAVGDTMIVNIGTASSTGNTLICPDINASSQINLSAGNTINIVDGTATLNGSGTASTKDTWNGDITFSSSFADSWDNAVFTLDGLTHSTANGSYSQTGGTLNLQNGANLSLATGTQSTPTTGTITTNGNHGTTILNIGLTAGADNSSLTLTNGSLAAQAGDTLQINIGTATSTGNSLNIAGGTLASSAELTINRNNTLNMSAGTATLNGSYGTWAGTVNISGGSLTLDLISNSAGSTYIQTGGSTTISDGSTLTLASGSSITGGTVFLNGLNVDPCIINVAGGTISEAAIIKLDSPSLSQLNLSGGSVTLDGNTGTADKWEGSVTVTGGTLLMDSLTNLTGSTYNQSAGSTTLTDASTLTIGTGSSATGGNIILDGTAGKTGNTVNVSTGGSVASDVAINIAAGNNFNVSGGTATLNATGTGIDTWAGAIDVSDGVITLNAIAHDATTSGNYNQNGGDLVLSNASTLKIGTGSSITGGNVTYSGTGNTVNVSTGGSFTSDVAINIAAGNNFNLSGGTAALNGSGTGIDTWAGTVNASSGTLTLDNLTHDTVNGNYNQTGGTTTLQNSSILTTNLDTAGNALSGGSVVINDSTLNLSTAAGATVGASLSGNSAGIINKNGTGTLLLTGSNSGYNGTLNVNAGEVDFNAASGTRDSYISGITNLGSGSTLKLNTNGSYVTSSSNNIEGTGTVDKTGSGEYKIYAGTDGAFDYTLNVNEGTMSIVTDSSTTANFNAPVSVNSSILRLSSGGTSFNEGLTLDHGYMSILSGGFSAISPDGILPALTVGSTVNTMNGAIASNTITGDLNIGASGVADFLIDVSPSTGTSDKYVISGDITTTNPTGIINIPDFKIVGAPTLVQNVTLNIFDQTAGGGTIESGVTFDATNRTIKSHHSLYTLSSLGSGSYMLNREGFNPQVFRGQVATQAAYANQLTTNNILFDHIGLVSQQLLSEEKPNVYANENPLFAPYQYSKKDGSLWYKGYGNIERLQLSQGINTQNNLWGSLVGADFPLVQLKNGWSVLPTAYVGYTGGYQTYNGVNMYQNGGQGGIMGTFYKGNFVTSLLANVGGYGNDMSLEGTRDTTGNWFAGIASKSAYNVKLPKDFILQPNMLVSYNAFGGQNWGSDYGGTSMTTNMMNGLNLAPGVNLILNKDTWSVYLTTQLMCNLMNGTSGTTGDINLPTVKMSSTYFQYGLGFTKKFKDRLSAYGQILFSNGVRTGVGFQGGLQWKF